MDRLTFQRELPVDKLISPVQPVKVGICFMNMPVGWLKVWIKTITSDYVLQQWMSPYTCQGNVRVPYQKLFE